MLPRRGGPAPLEEGHLDISIAFGTGTYPSRKAISGLRFATPKRVDLRLTAHLLYDLAIILVILNNNIIIIGILDLKHGENHTNE